MKKHAISLKDSALPRRREEFLKLLQLKDPSKAFIEAFDLGVLKVATPHLHEAMKEEAFINELHHFHRPYTEPIPLILFGLFIHAYYRSFMSQPTDSTTDSTEESSPPIHTHEIMENESLSVMMKDELGMSKYEQQLSVMSIQMQNRLAQRNLLETRGKDSLLAIVKSEAYPLALEFAKVTLNISPNDLLFWENFYESHRETIRRHHKEAARKRYRRPRKSRVDSTGFKTHKT